MASISPGIALNQLTKTVQERYSVNVRGMPKKVIESVYRSITEGRLQMPPLVLSEDKTVLIDRKSPLSGKDYKVLFNASSTKRQLYRLADKLHLIGYKELKKQELVAQIKEKLVVTGISEPILLQVKRKSKNVVSPLPNNVPFNNESPRFNNNNQSPKFNNNNQSPKFNNNNQSPKFNNNQSPKFNNNQSPKFNNNKPSQNNNKKNEKKLKVPSIGIQGKSLSSVIPTLNIGGGYSGGRGGLFSFGRRNSTPTVTVKNTGSQRSGGGFFSRNTTGSQRSGGGFFSSLFRGMRKVPVNENTEIDKYAKIYQNEFLIEEELARRFATFYVKSFKQNPSMPTPQILNNTTQLIQFIRTHKNTIIITYKKYNSFGLTSNHVKLLYKSFIAPILKSPFFLSLETNSRRNTMLKYFIYYLDNGRLPPANNDFRRFITNFENNSQPTPNAPFNNPDIIGNLTTQVNLLKNHVKTLRNTNAGRNALLANGRIVRLIDSFKTEARGGITNNMRTQNSRIAFMTGVREQYEQKARNIANQIPARNNNNNGYETARNTNNNGNATGRNTNSNRN